MLTVDIPDGKKLLILNILTLGVFELAVAYLTTLEYNAKLVILREEVAKRIEKVDSEEDKGKLYTILNRLVDTKMNVIGQSILSIIPLAFTRISHYLNLAKRYIEMLQRLNFIKCAIELRMQNKIQICLESFSKIKTKFKVALFSDISLIILMSALIFRLYEALFIEHILSLIPLLKALLPILLPLSILIVISTIQWYKAYREFYKIRGLIISGEKIV